MSNNHSTQSVTPRIQELLVELQESRDDLRHNDTIIMQTVVATATILGIVSGISLFSIRGDNNILQAQLYTDAGVQNAAGILGIIYSIAGYLTPARLFFYISCLAFCAAFSYITTRGIRGALQYYYIQNIEDRLHSLINNQSDDEGRNFFVHFDDYIVPITTLNIKHISSSYTAWHYLALLLVAICAVGCSLAFVVLQYFTIKDTGMPDEIILLITISVMVIALIMYIRTANNAKDIARFSMNTAHDNILARVDDSSIKEYSRAGAFRHYLLYYLFPRAKDMYKTCITISGYLYTCMLLDKKVVCGELFLLLFIFEFLLYGARYQINDIRGIREDKDMHIIRFLAQGEKHPQKAIKNSWIIINLKVCAAILLTLIIMRKKMKSLFICYALLLLSLVLYEASKWLRGRRKDKEDVSDFLVYFAVGTGYPLRFFTGSLFARQSFAPFNYPNHFWILLCSLFFLGSFASIMSWAQTISQLMKDTENGESTIIFNHKKHYIRIQNRLKHRQNCDGTPYLLRRTSIKNDAVVFWNLFFFISSGTCLLAASISGSITGVLIALLLAGVLLNAIIGGKELIAPFISECIFSVLAIIYTNTATSKFYLFVFLIIILTYCIQRSEFGKEHSLFKTVSTILKFAKKLILGDYESITDD